MPELGELTTHLIEGTLLDLSTTVKRVVIRGIIKGLSATTDPDPETIWRAVQVLADNGLVLGSALANHNEFIFQRMIIRGFTNDGVIVDTIWETPTFGGPASAFIIRDRSFMGSITSNAFIDAAGLLVPIKVRGGTFDGEILADDFADITRPVPLKAIQTYGLIYGQPGDESITHGVVNHVPWHGFPRGFWLLTEYETDVARYQGYYTRQATAITQVTHPWRFFSILRSKLTGKYIQIPDSVRITMNAQPYTPQTLVAQAQGATAFDPYAVANFFSIFGIN